MTSDQTQNSPAQNSPTQNSPDIPARLRDANRLIGSGAAAEARAVLDQVLAAAPEHPGAHAFAGIADLTLGEATGATHHLAKAVHHLAKAARGLPSNAAIHGNLATALRRSGLTSDAIAPLRRAILLDPGQPGPVAAIAQAFLDLERTAAAAKAHVRATVMSPADPALWYNLGVLRVKLDDLRGAARAFRRNGRLLRGKPLTDVQDAMPSLPSEPVRPVSRVCCLHRLTHDRDQLTYLRALNLLPDALSDEPERYQALIDGLSEAERTAVTFSLDDVRYQTIARSWNRFVHLEDSGWDADSPTRNPALNPALDWDALDRAYAAGDPRCLAIDGLLAPDALTALQRVCRRSTFWHQIKGAGYLGAYLREGFNDPLIIQVAHELRTRLPRALGDQPVRMIWAYSYDQAMVGINPHADFAGVNMNFWITENAANLEPETGGLLVWRKAAPADWDFKTYNTASADFIHDFLGEDRDDFIRIAHRENRAALFDSRLIHETDRARFAPGFENRRINITMLFGDGG
jgi:Flp pilus assembly protein TadD